MTDNLNVTGNLDVDGTTDVDGLTSVGNVGVTGDVTASGTITGLDGHFTNDLDVDGDLNVDGDGVVDGTLSAGGEQIVWWRRITSPTAGYIASKTSGWTADRFTSATGGLEVDFSGSVTAGTKAVWVEVVSTTTSGECAVRPAGDDAYCSNTPFANNEHFAVFTVTIDRKQVLVWLSADYKAEFAVDATGIDIYVSYPFAELR